MVVLVLYYFANRPAPLVMRACEGCRRRKIKCDAATTNTWPCSACIRLKLHCVRPNGYDGSGDPTYDGPLGQPDQFQHMPMQQPMMQAAPKTSQTVYAPPPPGHYSDASTTAGYQGIPYDAPQSHQPSLNYTSVQPPVSTMDPPYAGQGVFPTPPLQPNNPHEPSPEAYSPESYAQQDLSELLGNLKVDEKGTGMAILC